MKIALECAKQAFDINEVPIGAIVVCDGEVIGRGYNTREATNDVTAHAEIAAIKDAAKHLNTWKLDNCQLYVTVKPCLMCYSAIEQSRIKIVYFGVDQYSFKKKAFDTLIENSKVEMVGPILENECKGLMKDFFGRMRNGNK